MIPFETRINDYTHVWNGFNRIVIPASKTISKHEKMNETHIHDSTLDPFPNTKHVISII